MKEPQSDGAPVVADEMDRIQWDYDSEDELTSPLVKTERYFRDFPWDQDGDADSDPPR